MTPHLGVDMRSKKINRHHIVRQNFMENPKKITVFHLENFHFWPKWFFFKNDSKKYSDSLIMIADLHMILLKIIINYHDIKRSRSTFLKWSWSWSKDHDRSSWSPVLTLTSIIVRCVTVLLYETLTNNQNIDKYL